MSKMQYFLVWLVVIFSIAAIYLTTPFEHFFARSADEGYYFMYAHEVAKKGMGQFPLSARWYAQDKFAYLYPSPMRIAHTLLTSLWLKLFGYTFVSLARFSLFCFVLFLILSFYFCKKYFDKDKAYLYLLLLSCSPLAMAMAARALSDSNGNLFSCLVIWLFFIFLLKPSKLKYFLFFLFFYFTVLIRESYFTFLVFFVPFFLIHKYYYKNKISNLYLYGTVVLLPLLVFITYLLFFGGWQNMLPLLKVRFAHHFIDKPSQYGYSFCTGPWYKYIIDFILIEPITMLLFIGYLFHLIISRDFEWKKTFFFSYFILDFIMLNNIKYGKIVRLGMNLDIVINLFAVFMLYEIFKQNKHNTDWIFRSALFIAIANICIFWNLFFTFKIYDPISYSLLVAEKIIPQF